ncbi:hypothetical protein PG993_012539 [Apiospora rasikravindrae]|uniref:Cytochrome P450 n=1 Tax=Apiospora rasikravindrae TaxID=990691 RepID=A0ABR1S354_9PEZI
MAGLTVLLAVGALLALAGVADTGLRLLHNYRLAKTIGAPIRVIPISPLNPFWVLLDRKVLPLLRRLPFGDNSFTRYNWRGWEVEDRWRSHYEMGDIWVLVTPFKNWVYINDPDSLMSVFRRGNEITRPVVVTEILNVFGPNISTAEGERWKTQRRILTHCFNEANNKIVWSEAITLATDMLQYWTTKGSIRSSAEDLRTLSLHVLSRAAFGKSFKFEGADERDPAASSTGNYKQSLQTILENCVLILALGTKALALPWPSRKLRSVYAAWVNFHDYMTGMYEEGKRASAEGKATDDHNLLTLMVRASQADPESLTESEIYGNMFAVSFAGHDTTANTLTFALHFLAAHPAVQDWLAEEIRDVFGDREPQAWDYRTDFPRLKRCLSVMYETMRLYTPVPVLKWTADKAQPVTVHDRTYVLPPHSMIAPSYGAIQTDPRIWGSDSLSWRPSRWIKRSSPSSTPTGNEGEEEFHMPPRGAFVAWSEGTRDCVGRKFSQVEFVATMAVLFRRWRVDPVVMPGETTLDEARRRVVRLIETDSYAVLLLQMLHPERAPLVWRRA